MICEINFNFTEKIILVNRKTKKPNSSNEHKKHS